MFRKDKYRTLMIIAFIVLTLCSFILFITLWNNINLNQQVVIGNIIYLYLFLIFACGVVIFLISILQISEIHMGHSIQDKPETAIESEEIPKSGIESMIAPYDIDIDDLASFVVPKIDFKESLDGYTEKILQNLAKEFDIVQGVFYLKDEKDTEFYASSTFAWASEKPPASFKAGEGLTGQVAKNKTIMNINHIPEHYMIVVSGLGSGSPINLLIVPLLVNKDTIGIIELASFKNFDDQAEWTLKNLSKIIANGIITKRKAHQEKK
ncbi:MAG: hypothetical protein AMS27_00130 [Bacteroides sp. SM23_62_1]|nr:MAG: hypothetical protein AMS27_00130 [Bacteroides sp. SM23_62_1]